MNDQEEFEHWLKERRKALDLTQRDLAERVRYSLATIQQIEQGKRRPSRELAERLAAVLEIPTEEYESFMLFARKGVRPDQPPPNVFLPFSGRIAHPLYRRLLAPILLVILVIVGGAAYQRYQQPRLICSVTKFDHPIQLQPDNATAYFKRGQHYYDQEEYPCALADFDQAIRYSPNNGWAYYGRGSAYFKEDNYERAIQDFTQAIQYAELRKYDWVYWKRGLAYEWQGQIEKAITDVQMVLKLSTNSDLRKLAVDELDKLCKKPATAGLESCR